MTGGSHHSGRKSVLVVEDDPAVRATICNILEEEGLTARGASNGHEAIELLRLTSAADRPHVILLDLMMPLMNGWLFYDELREDPALAAIPVIVMSAQSTSPGSLKALPFLRKPLHLEDLLSAVQSVP